MTDQIKRSIIKKIEDIEEILFQVNKILNSHDHGSNNIKLLETLCVQGFIAKNIVEFLKNLEIIKIKLKENKYNKTELYNLKNEIIEVKNYLLMKFYHYL
ncbi:MAG: hypothetical protein ACTSRP_00635 [Candidatus Helarchaeota archaeon]